MGWKKKTAEEVRSAYERLRESPTAVSVVLALILLIVSLFALAWKEAENDALRRELALAKAQIAAYESAGDKSIEVKAEATSSATTAYVPKAYVTADDGSRTYERTDAEISVAPPTVAVKYNDKEYDLPGIAGETTKFERGKIQSAVTTHATLDLTPLIDTAAEQKARTAAKHFSIGMYGTSAGAAVGIGYENRDYGIDLLVHPIEPSKFWGVGVRRRV